MLFGCKPCLQIFFASSRLHVLVLFPYLSLPPPLHQSLELMCNIYCSSIEKVFHFEFSDSFLCLQTARPLELPQVAVLCKQQDVLSSLEKVFFRKLPSGKSCTCDLDQPCCSCHAALPHCWSSAMELWICQGSETTSLVKYLKLRTQMTLMAAVSSFSRLW